MIHDSLRRRFMIDISNSMKKGWDNYSLVDVWVY